MRRFGFVTAVLVGLVAVQDARPQGDKPAKLDGTWVVESMKHGDEENAGAKGDKVTFAGDKITIKEKGGEEKHAAYKADPAKKPAQIDVTPSEGNEQGEVHKGIYVLKGDELTICLARPGTDRPTEPASGSGLMLVVLKRAK